MNLCLPSTPLPLFLGRQSSQNLFQRLVYPIFWKVFETLDGWVERASRPNRPIVIIANDISSIPERGGSRESPFESESESG